MFRHPAGRQAIAVVFAALFLTPLPARADETEAGVFNFVLENDLFLGADRHYTNGFQAS
ncbi:lipid A-modifier LpxR family protein, partial [Salmonella enterica]|uniref:lipid A-modifier LpxR family protein n=1 Tax=Salmonella enterica TaxID=28901 RepID=UPI003D2E162D